MKIGGASATVCSCDGDLCNGVSQVVMAKILTLILSVTLVLYFNYYY